MQLFSELKNQIFSQIDFESRSASDCKMRMTDVADTGQLFRLI